MSQQIVFAVSKAADGNMSRRYSADAGANLERFLAKHGLKEEQSFSIECERKSTVLDVRDYAPGDMIACDGLISNRPGSALLLPIADCLGICIYDPINNVIALIHAG